MAGHDLRTARWLGAPALVWCAALLVSSLVATGCARRHEPITRTVLEVFPGRPEAQRTHTLLVCFPTPLDEHVTEQVAPTLTNRYYTGAVFRPLFIQGLVREFANVREAPELPAKGAPADYVVVISEFASHVRTFFGFKYEATVGLRCEVRGPDGEILGGREISAYRTQSTRFLGPTDMYASERVLGNALVACAEKAITFITRTVDAKGGKK